VICPLRKSTRRQKAAVCVVENVGVLNCYIYPIRYGDASVFTHILVRLTAAERRTLLRHSLGNGVRDCCTRTRVVEVGVRIEVRGKQVRGKQTQHATLMHQRYLERRVRFASKSAVSA
jgi:hypothetical protein